MTIQTDPARCWVRIDTEDPSGDRRYHRTLIGDSWAREPFGVPGLADEFSIGIAIKRVSGPASLAGPFLASAGMRLNRAEGAALRAAIDQWLGT